MHSEPGIHLFERPELVEQHEHQLSWAALVEQHVEVPRNQEDLVNAESERIDNSLTH